MMGMTTFYSCFLILVVMSFLVLGTMYLTLLNARHIRAFKTMLPDISERNNEKMYKELMKAPPPRAPTPNPLPRCPHVLIFTHPRSGSTLTGDIIQKSRGSFYVFEPLRFLEESIEKGEQVLFLNRTKRHYNMTDKVWLEAEIIYRWFTCDFYRINIQDLTSRFIGTYSNNLNEYAECLRNTRKSQHPVIRCMQLIRGICNSAGVRAIKTVRLTIASVELLLQWMPRLKIIYLVRDPRGKLTSQATLTPTQWEIITFLAKDLCNLLHAEIEFIRRLTKTYSSRLKILMYEKFAEDPIGISRKLYAFLPLKYTTELKIIVKKYTLSDIDKTGCYWCIKKTNSAMTANRWRERAMFKYIREIDKQCKTVYNLLGYAIFENEATLRNTSISVIGDSTIVETFL